MRIAFSVIFIVFLAFNTINAQSPGGVSGALVWMKANTGTSTTTNGTGVLTWTNQMGGGNGTQTTAVNQPTFQNGTNDMLNFNPVIRFNHANSQYFNLTQNIYGNATARTAANMFAITKNNTISTNSAFWYESNSNSALGRVGQHLPWPSNEVIWDAGSSTNEERLAVGNAVAGIVAGTPFLWSFLAQSTTQSLKRDGATVANEAANISYNFTNSYSYIGRSELGYWGGDVGEIVGYGTSLTSTQIQQIESYLAIKYGKTIDQSTACNYLASDGATIFWNGTTNSGYKNNIAGIARDDNSALNQKQSKSVNSGLQVVIGNGNTIAIDNISNANNFSANKSALVWGDNAGSVATWTATGAPANRVIVARTWKVQETGTVGSVKLQVADNSGSNGLPNEGTTSVLLLVDADGNFSSGATEVAMTLNGTNWEANVDLTNGQFFTFAKCDIGDVIFALGTTSTRCQGAGTVTYTATSTNSSGMSYSLDATSVAAGNSINSTTGAVTYVAGWAGTSTITATATGCSTKSDTHTVTITPTVGTPVFDSGSASQRCRAAGTVIYNATASNSTGISYSLDATSLAAGNTINTSTGAVTYSAGWSGTSTITASATGCNGPKTAAHTVTTSRVDAIDDNVSGLEGEPIVFNVLANDLCDYNPNSVTIISQPANGNLVIGQGGQITYLPNGTFSGTDQFTYQVSSNAPIVSDQAVVHIEVESNYSDPCIEANRAKTYYLPFPENTTQLRKSLLSAASYNYLTNVVRTVISLKTPYTGTVITYDHWEDGYETDISRPIQSTTVIWGDGNLTNGIAPGYPTDILPAGGYIYIDNQFTYNPRSTSEIAYDAKDKILSTNDIAVAKISGDAGYGGGNPLFSVQNIKTNVYDTSRFGKYFQIPFGEDVTLGGTSAFKYTGIFIRASKNSTTVNVDYNNDNVYESTINLNEGEVFFYDGTASSPGVSGDINNTNDIKAGGIITSNQPIGVDLLFGGIDLYGTRNMAILPSQFYGSTYYSPIYTTLATAPVYAFFTNLKSSPITINWSSGSTSGSLVLPANGYNYLELSNPAAYKFQSTNADEYTAIAVVDADATSSTYDWSFNMIPESRLTDFASIAWAPGSSDLSGNYNPVWVTSPTATTVYIKYDGNMTTKTATMSPCNLPYDIAVPLTALQSYKIYDPTDNDQTGLAVYTCDGAKIAAIWGQDPNAGNPTPTGFPAQDVGFVMEPRCLQNFVIASDDHKSTNINTAVNIGVLTNDAGFLCSINSNSLTNTGLLQPGHGTVIVNNDGTITYTPADGYSGTDKFEYSVCSTEFPAICDVATVTITVSNCIANATENLINGKVFIEQLPDDAIYNNESGASGVRVNLYNDINCNGIVDGQDAITASVLSDLSGNYSFSVKNGYNSKDDFDPTASFAGNDGGVNWNSSWAENGDDNVLTTGDVRIMQDASTGGQGNAIRITGASNGISRTMLFSNATAATLRFSVRRQSLDNQGEALNVVFNGTTIYTVTDGDYVGTDVNYADITVHISSFNPNASNTLQFIGNATVTTDDYFWMDNVDLSYSKATACYIAKADPTNTGGSYSSSALNSATATFSSLGTCDNDNNLGVLANLVVTDDNASTATNTAVAIAVLANDIIGKANAGSVTITGVTNTAANGTLVVNNDGTITYTPNPGFSGTDDFEYRVCSMEDPNVCDVGLVTVTTSCVVNANQNTITGQIFNDINGNGILNIGEGGLSGILVDLYHDTNNNGTLNTGEPLLTTKETNSLGSYQFDVTPPYTSSNYLDQFNSNTTANQSYGTTTWSTSWTETGTTNGFATAPVRITAASGLSIEGNGTATVLGAYRAANLSSAIAATLSFNYTELGLDLVTTDYVDVQVANSSNPTSWTLLKRYTGADGLQSGTGSFDLTPYMSATTTIRFVTSGNSSMLADDMVNFENVLISYYVPTAAKYVIKMREPLPSGTTLTTPTSAVHTASFTAASQGDCQNDFGLSLSPVAINDINTTFINMPVSANVLTNDFDINGYALTATVVTNGATSNGGSISISANGTYTYTPSNGFIGQDTYLYTVCNTLNKCDQATITIDVFAPVNIVNVAPTAITDAYTTLMNKTVTGNVISNDFDVDNNLNMNSITLVNGGTATSNGTLILNTDGTFIYYPLTGYTGQVSFTYSVCDTGTPVLCDQGTVVIDIYLGITSNSTFAIDDAFFGIANTPITADVKSNDYDPQLNTETVNTTLVSMPSHGSLQLNQDGTFTYTPNKNFKGNDQFVYEVCDNGSPQSCDRATVYITISRRLRTSLISNKMVTPEIIK